MMAIREVKETRKCIKGIDYEVSLIDKCKTQNKGKVHYQSILATQSHWRGKLCAGKAMLKESDFRKICSQSNQETTIEGKGITCFPGCNERNRYIEIVDSPKYHQTI